MESQYKFQNNMYENPERNFVVLVNYLIVSFVGVWTENQNDSWVNRSDVMCYFVPVNQITVRK